MHDLLTLLLFLRLLSLYYIINCSYYYNNIRIRTIYAVLYVMFYYILFDRLQRSRETWISSDDWYRRLCKYETSKTMSAAVYLTYLLIANTRTLFLSVSHTHAYTHPVARAWVSACATLTSEDHRIPLLLLPRNNTTMMCSHKHSPSHLKKKKNVLRFIPGRRRLWYILFVFSRGSCSSLAPRNIIL